MAKHALRFPRAQGGRGLVMVALLSLAVVSGVRATIAPVPPPSQAHATGVLQPRTLSSNGIVRSYLLYLPTSYQVEVPLPLVLALHGLGGSGEQFARSSRLVEEAERSGFVVAFPTGVVGSGLAGLRGWDVTAGDSKGDTRFLASVIDAVAAEVRIDPLRVYAVGHSNGGGMSYRLACDLSDRIAAVGIVAGFAVNGCRPERPVAVLHIHGTDDRVVPISGGIGVFGIRLPPTSLAIERWVALNGCAPTPLTVLEAGVSMGVTRTTYTDCTDGADVALITIDGAGHSWPGDPSPLARLQGGSDALNATAIIWQFLDAHPRR